MRELLVIEFRPDCKGYYIISIGSYSPGDGITLKNHKQERGGVWFSPQVPLDIQDGISIGLGLQRSQAREKVPCGTITRWNNSRFLLLIFWISAAHHTGTARPNCFQWSKYLFSCVQPTCPLRKLTKLNSSVIIFVWRKKAGKRGSQSDHIIVLFTLLCCLQSPRKEEPPLVGNMIRDLHWVSSNHRRIQGWEWATVTQGKRTVNDGLPISWPLAAPVGKVEGNIKWLGTEMKNFEELALMGAQKEWAGLKPGF